MDIRSPETRALLIRTARRLSRKAEADPEQVGWFALMEWRHAVADETGWDLKQINLLASRQPLCGLLKDGIIVENPIKLGNRNAKQYRVAGLDLLTLGDLVRHAESCIDPSHRGDPGRAKTLDGPRRVEVISKRQYRRICTSANKLARYLSPAAVRAGLCEGELWETVRDASLWIQDTSAQGPSEWTRMREAMIKASGSPADIGAVDLLLDLAATHELIERIPPSERFIVPVTWAPAQERWLKVLGTSRVVGRQYGLGQLLRAAASVLGPDGDIEALRDPAVCDRVLDHLRDRLLATSHTSATQRVWIRKSVRSLMDAGEIASVTIDRFDLRKHDRMRQWSSEHDAAIAAAHAAWDERAMDAAWDAFPYPGLADASNPYSLRRAVEFVTCPKEHRADRRGRVLAELDQFPRRVARRADREARLWSEPTTRGNLTIFSYFFAVLERYADLDLRAIDLRAAFRREYLDLVLQAHKDGRLSTRMAHDICVYTGFLASPWLETVAIEDLDESLADRLFEYSAAASGHGTVTPRSATGFAGEAVSKTLGRGGGTGRRRTSSKTTAVVGKADKVEIMRREADRVQQAYEAATGCEFAYDGMVVVYEAALSRVLRNIGVQSVAELNERWDELGGRINSTRRQELRALALWNDLLAAPMRDRATTEQTMCMRRWKGGRLILETPGKIHKVPQNGRYVVTLWEEGSGYDLDTWKLWVERLRPAMLNGHKTDLVWVNDFCSRAAKHPQISKTSEQLKKVTALAAAELGFDHAILSHAVYVHTFRHGVASKLAAREQLRLAADLLHHKTTEMVEKVYRAKGDRASTGAIRAGAHEERSRAATDAELLDRLKSNPELIRQLLEGEPA